MPIDPRISQRSQRVEEQEHVFVTVRQFQEHHPRPPRVKERQSDRTSTAASWVEDMAAVESSLDEARAKVSKIMRELSEASKS